MRLSGGVKIQNRLVTIDINRLRYFNMMIAVFAMLLIFYIGFTRINKVPVFHLLFATICVCVPMLSYVCAGVNNIFCLLIGSIICFYNMWDTLNITLCFRGLVLYLPLLYNFYVPFMSSVTYPDI